MYARYISKHGSICKHGSQTFVTVGVGAPSSSKTSRIAKIAADPLLTQPSTGSQDQNDKFPLPDIAVLDENEEDCLWPSYKEDRLVEMFRERPFLYDLNAPGYQNRYKKAKAMKEMSEALKVHGT